MISFLHNPDNKQEKTDNITSLVQVTSTLYKTADFTLALIY